MAVGWSNSGVEEDIHPESERLLVGKETNLIRPALVFRRVTTSLCPGTSWKRFESDRPRQRPFQSQTGQEAAPLRTWWPPVDNFAVLRRFRRLELKSLCLNAAWLRKQYSPCRDARRSGLLPQYQFSILIFDNSAADWNLRLYARPLYGLDLHFRPFYSSSV